VRELLLAVLRGELGALELLLGVLLALVLVLVILVVGLLLMI